jgi:hypothetical protein
MGHKRPSAKLDGNRLMTRPARQTALSIGLLLGCFSTSFNSAALAQLPLPPQPRTTLWSLLGISASDRDFRVNAFDRSGNRPGMDRKPLPLASPPESAPTIPPQAATPKPAPVAIDNPPVPISVSAPAKTVLPRAAKSKPTPVAIDSSGSSRRTELMKAQPIKSTKPAESAFVVKDPLPLVDESAYDAPTPTSTSTPATAPFRGKPHWTPTTVDQSVEQSVFMRNPFRDPLPTDEAVTDAARENLIAAFLPDRNQVAASKPAEIDETVGLAPIVSPDAVKRSSAKSKRSPNSPPSSGAATVVLPVSVQVPSQGQTSASELSRQPEPPHYAADVSLTQLAKPARPKALAPRQSPAAEFGTGTVTRVLLKDRVVLIEFNTNASLPAGSLLRAYHRHASATKKAVCDLQVVESENGKAIAIAHSQGQLSDLAVGDRAVVLQ